MRLDDVRVFFRITGEKDPESGQNINTQASVRRMHVTNYGPGMKTKDTTVVSLINGEKILLDHKFSEFHAWVMAPAFERDAALKAAGLKKSPGRPPGAKNRKGETPEEESVGG